MCGFSANSVSVVLVEEKRCELDLEEVVPDSGQEMRA